MTGVSMLSDFWIHQEYQLHINFQEFHAICFMLELMTNSRADMLLFSATTPLHSYTDVGYQQPVGRSPFQESTRSLRVIPSSQGVCTVGNSPYQRLCIIPKSPSPTVVQHHILHIVNVHQFCSGELNTIQDLRVSSYQPDPTDIRQNKERLGRGSDSNTSLLAMPIVVQSLFHLGNCPAHHISSLERSVISAALKQLDSFFIFN